MIISGGEINIVAGSYENAGHMQSAKDIKLDVGTLNNSGNIESQERVDIRTSVILNNTKTGRIEGRAVSIEGEVANAEQAIIRGNESLTLPDRLIQALVGAESVTADAVITTHDNLVARGGSLIGSTLTINPL